MSMPKNLLSLALLCGSILLCGGDPCGSAAVPTEESTTTVTEEPPTTVTEEPPTTVIEEGSGADNITTTEEPKENGDAVTKDIWQIIETTENKSVPETDGIISRFGWGTKKQEANFETLEGWLNSGIISNDVNIPYRAQGLWSRVGNSSEDWKKYLTKPSTLEHYHHDKISRINYNERRRFPFQFHWQNNPKRLFNYTKTT